jgi:hypothetical protein
MYTPTVLQIPRANPWRRGVEAETWDLEDHLESLAPIPVIYTCKTLAETHDPQRDSIRWLFLIGPILLP